MATNGDLTWPPAGTFPWPRTAFRGLVKGGDEAIGDALGCGPRADRSSCVTSGLANEADPTGGSSLQLGDERWVFTFESPQRDLDVVSVHTRLLHDLVRAHDSPGALEHLHSLAKSPPPTSRRGPPRREWTPTWMSRHF